MKRLTIMFVFLVAAIIPMKAQNTYDCEIDLLEKTEKTALFSVQVEVDKKTDVEKCACEALLFSLVTKGIDGIHDGRPLSTKEPKYWKNENNLFKSEDNYLKYTAYQLESEPITTTSGKFQGKVYVQLNQETFVRYLERYGVLNK